MHYEIQVNGNVIDTAKDFFELMEKYKVQRKKTSEPLHLEKVEDEDE